MRKTLASCLTATTIALSSGNALAEDTDYDPIMLNLLLSSRYDSKNDLAIYSTGAAVSIHSFVDDDNSFVLGPTVGLNFSLGSEGFSRNLTLVGGGVGLEFDVGHYWKLEYIF